ncbi:MAG: hypothetical protein Q4G44_06045 [Alcaligenaceae bacterium]|nr:hypothetical protein [Alcaligenaceae bacterium]
MTDELIISAAKKALEKTKSLNLPKTIDIDLNKKVRILGFDVSFIANSCKASISPIYRKKATNLVAFAHFMLWYGAWYFAYLRRESYKKQHNLDALPSRIERKYTAEQEIMAARSEADCLIDFSYEIEDSKLFEEILTAIAKDYGLDNYYEIETYPPFIEVISAFGFYAIKQCEKYFETGNIAMALIWLNEWHISQTQSSVQFMADELQPVIDELKNNEKDASSSRARINARIKHQRMYGEDKEMVKDWWDKWQQNPSLYNLKKDFDEAMLDKAENTTNIRTIQGWRRELEKADTLS